MRLKKRLSFYCKPDLLGDSAVTRYIRKVGPPVAGARRRSQWTSGVVRDVADSSLGRAWRLCCWEVRYIAEDAKGAEFAEMSWLSEESFVRLVRFASFVV
jgi:hypothetical protein